MTNTKYFFTSFLGNQLACLKLKQDDPDGDLASCLSFFFKMESRVGNWRSQAKDKSQGFRECLICLEIIVQCPLLSESAYRTGPYRQERASISEWNDGALETKLLKFPSKFIQLPLLN
jgi:hypothetical protein